MFIPLDDLSEKPQPERDVYYLEACRYLGVPPELNVLKWFWDDSKTGKRSLILYATRGATDIIRGNRGISTLDLIQKDGNGYITFTSVGQDPSGRIERAIGVAHIEGKTGAAFENAVKKAQTEAGRRMTLQFAGGGFLDESELPFFETNVPTSAPFISLVAPPTIPINDAPGVDVTPKLENLNPNTVLASAEEAQAAFEARMKAQREEALRQLGAARQTPDEPTLPTPAETPVSAVHIVKTRKRKSVNTVSLDAPGSVGELARFAAKVEAEPELLPVASASLVAPVSAAPTPVASPDVAAESATVVPTPPIEGLPSAEQLKDYRARLGKFANDILPSGGMMPTADVGGVTQKLRKFASLQLGVTDVMKATAEQWDDLMSFLDEYNASKGAAELVKYIDTAIGVK